MGMRPALFCLALLLTACASLPGRAGRARISHDELLAGTPLGLPEAPGLIEDEQVLALSPGMRTFVAENVSPGADRATRLRQLGRAVIRGRDFHLKYDETTRTAALTFQDRRGNCLSFSNMFVAMARATGLDARFQEVYSPPDWSFRADTFVLNRHVNVLVDLGQDGEHVVDFNMEDFRTSYDRREIRDERALAHFYNNLAVERMQAGEAAAALGYFRRAARHDPSFSPAWTNLGILYHRSGHVSHAEAAHLQALQADSTDLVAMSNLAGLYERQGERSLAAEYRKRASDHRSRNPYYRFQLAREAFQAGRYDAAIGYLHEAIDRKKNEDQFYFLLGLCWLKKGDPQAARRWVARAEAVAATDSLKRRYASKMDILLPPAGERPPLESPE